MTWALVVDADPFICDAAADVFTQVGVRPTTSHSIESARRQLEAGPGIVLLGRDLPDGDALELLHELHGPRGPVVIVMSDDSGATDRGDGGGPRTRCIPRSSGDATFQSALRGTLHDIDLHRIKSDADFGPMIGRSAVMRRLYGEIESVAPTHVSVLIHGESGTGKELVARRIHELSHRSLRPFLAINCGALSAQLAESELFGHEKGSFTGAIRQHHGYFEETNGGTLFLDEITEMPLDLQVKLLRVLETGSVTRVGGTAPIRVDVRIIAATNRNLDTAVDERKLRLDLLHRLSVFPLFVPPLRDRGDDAKHLAQAFVHELNERYDTNKDLAAGVLADLRSHDWPGNVRELRNVVERSFILASGEITALRTVAHSSRHSGRTDETSDSPDMLHIAIPTPIRDVERALIFATLREFKGSKVRTAQALGVSLKTLYNRLHEYGVLSEPRAK